MITIGRPEMTFLQKSRQELPAGAVGLIASDLKQIPDLLHEMLDHYEHYRATAATHSTAWNFTHAPVRTIEILRQQPELVFTTSRGRLMWTAWAPLFQCETLPATTRYRRSCTERSRVVRMRRTSGNRHEKRDAVANTYKRNPYHLGFILLLVTLLTGCHSIDRNVLRNQSPLKAIEKQPDADRN